MTERLVLGQEVTRADLLRGPARYVVSSVYADGCVVLTPIPDGMTAMDLGRRFFAARLERQIVNENATSPLAGYMQ